MNFYIQSNHVLIGTHLSIICSVFHKKKLILDITSKSKILRLHLNLSIRNVPSVWLQRIPFAGKKSGKHEDIKGVFGSDD